MYEMLICIFQNTKLLCFFKIFLIFFKLNNFRGATSDTWPEESSSTISKGQHLMRVFAYFFNLY